MSKEQSKVHAKLRDGIEGWQKAPTPRIFRGYVAESKQRKKKGNGELDQAQDGHIST